MTGIAASGIATSGRGRTAPGHEALRREVRAWVATHITPFVEAWERDGTFPRDLFPAAGAAGLFGWKMSPEEGGTGPDLLADAVVTEELASCGSGGVAAALGAHKDLGAYYLSRFGTAEQRRRWVPATVRGSSVAALAVTEPGAGSDVAALRTRAVQEPGGDWRLTGEKVFITNGGWADVVVVAAITDPDAGGHHGMSLFVVEGGDPAFSRRRIPTLGWRTSSTAALVFDDVRLPADRLLGGEEARNRGFVLIMRQFQWERIAMALAAARSAERTLAVLTERGAAAVRGTDEVLDALGAEVAAATALARHALRCYLADGDAVREVSMAKWFTAEVAVRAAEVAVSRYPADERVQRSLRDARLGPIGGGAKEVLLEVIARVDGL